MITITKSRQSARAIATKIHEWRKVNIEGYQAESWANCTLNDLDYDRMYKHHTEDLWYVPVDNESGIAVEKVESLPSGWVAETLGLP